MPSDAFGHVKFNEADWRQLQEYCDLCPVEVAAMGYATIEGSVVNVNEVFLVPQVVSGSSVEFMDTGFPWAVQKALDEGRIEELRFCWHSHVNFGAFFSATDKDMVRKVRNHGPIPWFCSVVLNKKGDTHAQLDYFKLGEGVSDFCNHLTLELDVAVGEIPEDFTEQREQELEEFLTKKAVSTSKTSSSGKSPATKADEALDKDEVVGASGCTPKDWKLHNKAKTEGWDCYVDPEHYVHYWDPKDGGKYKGSAPIPKNDDGSWKIDLKPNVMEADVVEALDHGENMTEDELDEYVQQVMDRHEL